MHFAMRAACIYQCAHTCNAGSSPGSSRLRDLVLAFVDKQEPGNMDITVPIMPPDQQEIPPMNNEEEYTPPEDQDEGCVKVRIKFCPYTSSCGCAPWIFKKAQIWSLLCSNAALSHLMQDLMDQHDLSEDDAYSAIISEWSVLAWKTDTQGTLHALVQHCASWPHLAGSAPP